jgi:hypothetical protein
MDRIFVNMSSTTGRSRTLFDQLTTGRSVSIIKVHSSSAILSELEIKLSSLEYSYILWTRA